MQSGLPSVDCDSRGSFSAIRRRCSEHQAVGTGAVCHDSCTTWHHSFATHWHSEVGTRAHTPDLFAATFSAAKALRRLLRMHCNVLSASAFPVRMTPSPTSAAGSPRTASTPRSLLKVARSSGFSLVACCKRGHSTMARPNVQVQGGVSQPMSVCGGGGGGGQGIP